MRFFFPRSFSPPPPSFSPERGLQSFFSPPNPLHKLFLDPPNIPMSCLPFPLFFVVSSRSQDCTSFPFSPSWRTETTPTNHPRFCTLPSGSFFFLWAREHFQLLRLLLFTLLFPVPFFNLVGGFSVVVAVSSLLWIWFFSCRSLVFLPLVSQRSPIFSGSCS